MLRFRFFISHSGRHYIHDGSNTYFFSKEDSIWVETSRTLQDIITDNRMCEFRNEDEFIFQARKAFRAQFTDSKE
jgi:hypothetical protein